MNRLKKKINKKNPGYLFKQKRTIQTLTTLNVIKKL